VVGKVEEGLTKRCTALAEQIQQGEPAAAERQAAVEGAMKELEAASVEDPGKCHGWF
jgi:N-acetylglutamate synthase/N-acetylornithine aminotransferase